MLLVAVIAWLVVVLGLSVWVALRARRLLGRIRDIQEQIERQVPAERIQEINARVAGLQDGQATLQDAVGSMQASLSHLSFVTTTGQKLIGPLLILRYARRR